MSSTIELNICAIIARIETYKSVIKKEKKKHDEITLLAKAELDCKKRLNYFWVFNRIIYWTRLLDVLRKYDDLKE